MHARHVWLIQRKESMRGKLEGDPDWYDAKVAGWWVWGVCNWIGGQWCDDRTGPWWVRDGQLVHLGDAGTGVSRQLVHLGGTGKGVSRKRVHLGDAGKGVSRRLVHLLEWFSALSDRLARVRVCCGDWSRVMGRSVTTVNGLTGIFLDPPYLHDVDGKTRADNCYGEHDCGEVANDVRDWCRENGDNKLLRIVLCGYEGEHELPGWSCVPWKSGGGMANQSRNGAVNAVRERLWLSPHCLQENTLFAIH